MTNDPLEAIRNLTSNKAAQENKARQDWGNFRSPVMDWEGDIPSDGITVDQELRGPAGDQRYVQGLKIRVINAKILKAVTPLDIDNFEFFVALPGGDDPKANLNSEMGQMVASINATNKDIDNLIDVRGKRLTAVGSFHEYKGNRFRAMAEGTKVDRRTGAKGEYEETTFSTAYYKITRIQNTGAASSNGASAKSAGPLPEETIAAIKGYVEALEDDRDSLNNIPETLRGLQSMGVDFTNPLNFPAEQAVINKKLPELAATFQIGATA